MNTMKNFLIKGLVLIAFPLLFTQCDKDKNDDLEPKGKVAFEMTDAPIDDTKVKGAFVTVAEVKVDGKAISNFSGKQTIDLMAYQNGDTKALGLAELETGTYSNVSLVLDYAKDANGNAPGCYVLTEDNLKHSLESSSNASGEIIINSGDFIVEENSTTNVVLDFDVRKAIKYQDSPQANDEYDFVTNAELGSSVRLVKKDKTSKIKGSVNDILGMGGDKIVVHAYAKGTFDQSAETQGQGNSNILFKNAVTSSVVADDGTFTLAFLEEGDYDLHFVSYQDNDNDGRLEVKGMLEVTSLTSLNFLGIELDAGLDVEVDVSVIGVIPL